MRRPTAKSNAGSDTTDSTGASAAAPRGGTPYGETRLQGPPRTAYSGVGCLLPTTPPPPTQPPSSYAIGMGLSQASPSSRVDCPSPAPLWPVSTLLWPVSILLWPVSRPSHTPRPKVSLIRVDSRPFVVPPSQKIFPSHPLTNHRYCGILQLDVDDRATQTERTHTMTQQAPLWMMAAAAHAEAFGMKIAQATDGSRYTLHTATGDTAGTLQPHYFKQIVRGL